VTFQAGLIYGVRERKLIRHFAKQGYLSKTAFVAFQAYRFLFLGLLASIAWIGIAWPVLAFPADNLDTIIVTAGLFCASFLLVAYVHAYGYPPELSCHCVMMIDCYSLFFCGIFFPWSSLPVWLKLLHYINPLFYVGAAATQLTLRQFDTRCGPLDPSSLCMGGVRVLREAGVQNITSAASQVVSLSTAMLMLQVLWVLLSRSHSRWSAAHMWQRVRMRGRPLAFQIKREYTANHLGDVQLEST